VITVMKTHNKEVTMSDQKVPVKHYHYLKSTGSVHSHTRRALAAGADRKEIEHALLVLVSTIGFPKVAAALAWIQEDFD